jgi:tetratricopeptide (TPR) repeat protein
MNAFLNNANHSLMATQKLHHILRRLIAIMQPFNTGTIPVFTQNDIQILIELIQHILEVNETQIVMIMNLIVAYELVWLHYTNTAQVILIAETCIAKCTAQHPVIYKLYKLLGNLYDYRGHNETAAYYFTKAISQFNQSGETLEWALTMLDFSFNLSKKQLSAEQMTATQMILTIFQASDMEYAYARGLDCLSRFYTQQGDITSSLQYSQQAINTFAGMTNTIGYMDALIHKALLYLILSDYEIAHQLFAQVIHITEINHWIHLNAVAKVRMAATVVLQDDPIQARYYLSQAAEVLLRLGNTSEILLVVDVYSLILLAENKTLTALQINDMSTLLREQLNFPRGIVLDDLVKSKRENIFTQYPNLTYTPLTHMHNIYEVINFIRTELQ